MRQMKEGCDAAGISIPYPQREVHVITSGGASPVAATSLSVSAGKSACSFAAGDAGPEADKGDQSPKRSVRATGFAIMDAPDSLLPS
ncbi:MAG: hypothetical protein WD969_10420 [Paracoccaceae bacterium]